MKVKKEGQGTLFKHSWLEFFTKTNPVIHVLTYGSVIALSLYFNQQLFKQAVSFFVGGVITWTFMEYVIHRFLFHIPASKFQYLIHGVHHEFPRDKERLMMPPIPGLVLVTFFFLIWYVLFKENAFVFMAGFVLSYMYYTFIHYIVHAWKPISGIKFLWTHHHKHHNPMYENTSYGVSSPLWDYIFGTMPPSK